MRVSRPLGLLQARAIVARINRHFGVATPVRAAPLNGGLHAPIPVTYVPGANGWTARWVRLVRIPSRNEIRIHVGLDVEALNGTMVDGAILDIGPFDSLQTLAPDEAPDENVS